MTKRDRIVVGVLAVAGLLAAYWFVLLKPRTDELKAARDVAATARTRVDAANQKLASAEAARAAYGRQLLQVARLGKAVPTDDDVPTLVFQLQTAAKKAGVDFRAVQIDAGASASTGTAATSGSTDAPGSVAGPDGLRQLPVKLTFEGSFFDLRKFLSVVHGFTRRNNDEVDVRGRLVSIDAVSLAAGPGGFPAVKASISASAYMAPAPLGAQANGATATGTVPPGATTAGAPAPPGATSSGTTAQSGTTPPPAVLGGLLP